MEGAADMIHMMQSDALALEYKRDYGCARRQIELTDIVNYPPLASEFRRLGLALPEKTLNLVGVHRGTSGDYSGNPLLIGE